VNSGVTDKGRPPKKVDGAAGKKRYGDLPINAELFISVGWKGLLSRKGGVKIDPSTPKREDPSNDEREGTGGGRGKGEIRWDAKNAFGIKKRERQLHWKRF